VCKLFSQADLHNQESKQELEEGAAKAAQKSDEDWATFKESQARIQGGRATTPPPWPAAADVGPAPAPTRRVFTGITREFSEAEEEDPETPQVLDTRDFTFLSQIFLGSRVSTRRHAP
jgi:hypothetical protein